MTALDESTQGPSEQPLWRQGTLSDDEFEKAALAITPSWELGLDAAASARLSAPPPTVVDSGSFAAPSAAVNALLAGADSELGRPSLAPPAPTTTTPSRAPRVVAVEASMTSAGAKVSDAPPRRPLSMRPPVTKRTDDLYEAPRRAGNNNNKLFAAIGGAMLLAGALFVGFASNSGPTPAPTTGPAAPAAEPAPTPIAAAPEAAPPPPAPEPPPVAAPEPPPAAVFAAPEPAPVAAPEPVAPPRARPRIAREPAHSPVVHAARPHPTAAAPVRPAAAAAPHAPSGAGFVTESPY